MKRIFYLVLALLISVNYCYATPDQTISTPKSFTANTTAQSGEVNQNFNEVSSKFNAHSHTDITSLGTVTTGLWNATVVDEQYGGTGSNFATATPGNLLYFSATGTLLTLGPGTSGQLLRTSGPNDVPVWGSGGASISILNTSVTCSDTGTDGAVTVAVDGVTVGSFGDNGLSLATQPAFNAEVDAGQDNIAINSAVTVIFGTERFDQGGDFASNAFTAPIDGRYLLTATFVMDEVDSAVATYSLYMTTSNKTYTVSTDFRQMAADIAGSWTMQMCVVADMDSSDTAVVQFYQVDGTQQTDIAAGTFHGHLVA